MADIIKLFGQEIRVPKTEEEKPPQQLTTSHADDSFRRLMMMASKVISDHSSMPMPMHCVAHAPPSSSSSKPPPAAAAAPPTEKKKRRHPIFEVKEENKKKKKKNKKNTYPQVPTADLSPKFVGKIGPCVDGPVFLYRKQLSGSDVLPNQNRLLVTEEEKVVDGFLTVEERKKFSEGPIGVTIDVVAVDGEGREYKVCLTKWETMIVFNNGWKKLVQANGAQAGHWVDLWGFRREDGVFHLAVNLIK